MISNSSQESTLWIRLHSSSEIELSSVDSLVCGDQHVLAKWFGLLQFLHVFPIARQPFKCPSRTFSISRKLFLFCAGTYSVSGIFFCLYCSLFGSLLFWPFLLTAIMGSCFILICDPRIGLHLQNERTISERLVLFVACSNLRSWSGLNVSNVRVIL